MTRMEMLKQRLKTYPGAHANEKWKLERDLDKCTDREKEQMQRLGITISQLMAEGLDRGQVHHILFGYQYAKEV